MAEEYHQAAERGQPEHVPKNGVAEKWGRAPNFTIFERPKW